MPECVKVQANARLHLGFLDLNGGFGRRFGSLGLSIRAPLTSLTLKRAQAPSCSGPEHRRVAGYVATLAQHLGLPNAYEINVDAAIPAHAGLGSGTQLALAAACALRQLEGLPEDYDADAVLLQRGARSGAGATLFRSGGLIVDGGHAERHAGNAQRRDGESAGSPLRKTVPPLLARYEFPEEWRIILVLDPDIQGVHGAAEREAFAQLPSFPAEQVGEICRSVLMQALPAVVERDLAAFGAAIARIQRSLGDFFAPAQGGSRFSSRSVGAIMQKLEEAGAHGIGQSSWGPTGFAFADGEAQAERLVAAVGTAAAATNLKLVVCQAANRGAIVQTGAIDQTWANNGTNIRD